MCGCQQGICPGGCACGCQHTSPTAGENALVAQFTDQIKSLHLTVDSLARAIYDATGTEVDAYGFGHELAMERLADLAARRGRAVEGEDREGMILHRLVVTMTLTDRPDDEAELVDVEVFGEPTLLTSLGMLRMAEDTLLHAPSDDA